MQFARREITALFVLVPQITLGMLELHVIQVSTYHLPTYLYPLPLAFWHHSALKVEKQCYEKRPITPKKIGTSQNCTFVSNFRTL